MKYHMKYTYEADTDSLFEEGVYIGGAADLTREMMNAELADPAEHKDDNDETLFDLLVENI